MLKLFIINLFKSLENHSYEIDSSLCCREKRLSNSFINFQFGGIESAVHETRDSFDLIQGYYYYLIF